MTQYKLCPTEAYEEQWGGLARSIMLWMDMSNGPKHPRDLLKHLERSGVEAPQWLLDEPEMQDLDHSMSKGTRCVLIYKAMLAAAPNIEYVLASELEAYAREIDSADVIMTGDFVATKLGALIAKHKGE